MYFQGGSVSEQNNTPSERATPRLTATPLGWDRTCVRAMSRRRLCTPAGKRLTMASGKPVLFQLDVTQNASGSQGAGRREVLAALTLLQDRVCTWHPIIFPPRPPLLAPSSCNEPPPSDGPASAHRPLNGVQRDGPLKASTSPANNTLVQNEHRYPGPRKWD